MLGAAGCPGCPGTARGSGLPVTTASSPCGQQPLTRGRQFLSLPCPLRLAPDRASATSLGGRGRAPQEHLAGVWGRRARRPRPPQAAAGLKSASVFPRKPLESFCEFLLILATLSPPPAWGGGGVSRQGCSPWRRELSALQLNPHQKLGDTRERAPLAETAPKALILVSQGPRAWVQRPAPSTHRADFSTAGNNEWGWGWRPIASQHRDRLPQATGRLAAHQPQSSRACARLPA